MNVYGFFHNDCYHESAPRLVSLHATKRGAFKAMIAHQYAMCVEDRSVKNTHLHMGKGWAAFSRSLKWYDAMTWHVSRLEVLP
ncbi:hypothetical protein LJR066_002823 [Acidovorax sp. LjRoot66]|uniref:hypothetical protein n=1 Tax=Acidovorax sp. LjRoot66 TaxID=3342334 RepID=UPI003ECEFA55